jgi:hypothetical protein
MNTTKSFPAKFPGACSCGCGARFAAGSPIVYSDRHATLVACIEGERAALAKQDAEDAALQAKWAADFKAGARIKSIPGPKELMVEGAPTYEMAKAEAFAVAANITAAGGRARILSHTRNGKRYVGRKVVSYYGVSTLGHHEGWAFKWACETA